MQQKNGIQGDQGGTSRVWLFVSVDVGRILLTDGLGEALAEKIMVLASGSSTLHIDFGLDKDVKNTTVDIEASFGHYLLYTVLTCFPRASYVNTLLPGTFHCKCRVLAFCL